MDRIYDLTGVIDPWYETNARSLARFLADAGGEDVTIRINSPGGSVFEGAAMYNMLFDYGGNVSAVVVGLAASAASVVAMAGDTITMHPGAFMMIHNSWTGAVGDTRDMTKAAALLAKIDKQLAGVYAQKTGKKVADIAALMDAETWFTADEAVAGKFADAVAKKEKVKAYALGDLKFKNLPGQISEHVTQNAGNPARELIEALIPLRKAIANAS